MAQSIRMPDIEAQRAAMAKLAFLVGKWSGEARLVRGPGEPAVVAQTEEALGPYKTSSVLRIDEKGEWTELHEISSGAQPARKLMELTVKKQE